MLVNSLQEGDVIYHKLDKRKEPKNMFLSGF